MELADSFIAPMREDLLFVHPSDSAFEISGTDALDWFGRMVTADLREQGLRVCRSLCLGRLGKIRGEVLCWLNTAPMEIVVIGGQRHELLAHLKRHIIMEDVDIRVVNDTLYSFHGSAAATITEQLGQVAGVRFERISWLTETDSVYLVPAQREVEWRERVDGLGLQIGDASAWQTWRIERGLPSFGQDYDGNDTPSAAGLVDGLVSQTKGCYLGQEVVCKTLMRGTVRDQAVRIRFLGTPKLGAEIRLAATGDPIGGITSVAEARDGGVWAIGRVRKSAIEARAKLVSDTAEGQILPRRVPR